MDAQQLRDMPLEDLFRWTARNEPNSPNHNMGLAELRFRELRIQIESTLAQKEAAEASMRSTSAAERNAKYMLMSVIATSAAALASAISAFFSGYSAMHPLH